MRRVLVAAILVLATTAPPAAAQDLVAGPLGVSGPVLVDDGAIWGLRVLRRDAFAVMGGRTGGALRGLMRSNERVRLNQGREGAYALSSNGSVATLIVYPWEWSEPHVWSGTVGGGLRPVFDPPDDCAAGRAESDGPVMAVQLGCGAEDFERVVVRVGGEERTFHAGRVNSGSYGVQVAGRYVAWRGRRGGEVVVYDTVADREILHAGDAGPLYLNPLALQPDGKLLVGIGDPFESEDTQTAWLSPAAPALHRLGIAPRTVRGFSHDRVLTLEPARDAQAEQPDRPLAASRAGLVGRDGSRRAVASARGSARIFGADYDGMRVALAVATCAGTRIVLRSAAAPALTLSEPGLCPLQVTSPPALAFGYAGPDTRASSGTDDRPKVSVRVRCGDRTLRPCGTLVLRALNGRAITRPIPDLNRDGSYRLPLTGAGARRIAREGSLPVRLEMRATLAGGPLVQRPATATLRAPGAELLRLRRCVRAGRDPARAGCPS